MRVFSIGGMIFAGDFRDAGDAFHGRGVRELRHSGDDVADGVQARLGRLHVRPDVNEAALEFGFRFFEAQIFRLGHAPDGHQHALGGNASASFRPCP